LNKYQTLFLALAIGVGLSSPTWADPSKTEPNEADSGDNTWLEVKYSPEQINGGNFSTSLSELKLRAETGLFDDKMRAGVYFQFTPSEGSGSVGNVAVSDIKYSDFEIYGKVPFSAVNWNDEENSGHDPYGFNLTIAYKVSQLTGNANQAVNNVIIPNQAFTFVNGQGFGGGIGYDAKYDRVQIQGLIAYYPSMNQSNIITQQGFTSTYHDFVYRVNARTSLGPQGSGFGLSLGFDGESQQFQNVTLNYTGVTGGVDYHF